MSNLRTDYDQAKTWATGHVVAAVVIAAAIGAVMGAILF